MEKFLAFISTAMLVAIALPAFAGQSFQSQSQSQADQGLIACHKHPNGHQAALQ
jgi:hypothetical protein